MFDGVSLPVMVSGVLVVIGAIITGIFGLVNHRTDARSKVAPTVEQIWSRLDDVEERLDREHSARVKVEMSLTTLRNIFVGYVNRVQSGGKTDLTTSERRALNEPPIEESTMGKTELDKLINDIKG
jgi:hypothetical protein